MLPGGSARHRLCPVYVFRATGSMPGSMLPVLFFFCREASLRRVLRLRFAVASNLSNLEPPVFIEDKFTD